MNIQVEAVGPSRKQISVAVPAEEVSRMYTEVTGNYLRYARIPGFRPGKAPVQLVRNRFRKEIAKELKEQLIPRCYQAAIKQEKIETLRVIDVTDPDPAEGQPYSFTVTVDVFPEFELPHYQAIRVAEQPVEVDEASVDRVVDQMRDRMANYEDAPGRTAEARDRVMVKYAALVEGQPMEDLVKDHPILAKSAEFGVILDPEFAFIPEFADGLVGMKEGDQKTLEVSFPEDFIEPALAGKKAEYHVEALKVQVKVLPEVTPAFLKTLSVDSVEALRARIRADLVRMKQGQEKRRIQDEICKHLLEQTAMVLPESEVQRQTADEVYDLVQYNTNRGIDRNAIEENRDQIFSAAAKTAEEKLKLRFILLKLAAAEKLNVTNAEVDAHLRVLAQRAHRDFTKLKAELEKNNRLDEAREDVICSKALAYLLEQQQPQPAPAASSGRSDV